MRKTEKETSNEKNIIYSTQNTFNGGNFICKLLCFICNRYVIVFERHKSHYNIHRFNCCAVTSAAFDMAEKEKEVFNNKENQNGNVDKLLEWILSDEGQYIINETGYVGIKN